MAVKAGVFSAPKNNKPQPPTTRPPTQSPTNKNNTKGLISAVERVGAAIAKQLPKFTSVGAGAGSFTRTAGAPAAGTAQLGVVGSGTPTSDQMHEAVLRLVQAGKVTEATTMLRNWLLMVGVSADKVDNNATALMRAWTSGATPGATPRVTPTDVGPPNPQNLFTSGSSDESGAPLTERKRQLAIQAILGLKAPWEQFLNQNVGYDTLPGVSKAAFQSRLPGLEIAYEFAPRESRLAEKAPFSEFLRGRGRGFNTEDTVNALNTVRGFDPASTDLRQIALAAKYGSVKDEFGSNVFDTFLKAELAGELPDTREAIADFQRRKFRNFTMNNPNTNFQDYFAAHRGF